jgi:hypothetical protein
MKADMNVQFTEASSRQSIESGESVKTLFGKIRKWLSDLKPVAFSGSYNDLSNKPTTGVSGVKGNSETSYRTGNVNLTPANIGAVNKSGDIMTGALTHNGVGTVLKNTNLDVNGDNPTSNTWSNAPIEYRDKDNARMGFVNVQRRTDGSTMLEIGAQARNNADTADIYNTIDMLVRRDGTRSYAVTDPAAFRTAINAASKDQVNYNTNNGVKNLLSTEWFATNPMPGQSGTVESCNVETGSITGFASASLTGNYQSINIYVDKMNEVLEDGKTYILSFTVDSMETNMGILGMRRYDNNVFLGGSVNITKTGDYSVSYTHNSSIPVYFSFCLNTAGLSTDKRIAISNLMLREAIIEDSTFEPYAKSNAELTSGKLDVTGTNNIPYDSLKNTFVVDVQSGMFGNNNTMRMYMLSTTEGGYIQFIDDDKFAYFGLEKGVFGISTAGGSDYKFMDDGIYLNGTRIAP